LCDGGWMSRRVRVRTVVEAKGGGEPFPDSTGLSPSQLDSAPRQSYGSLPPGPTSVDAEGEPLTLSPSLTADAKLPVRAHETATLAE
jgi:hypothetical protein